MTPLYNYLQGNDAAIEALRRIVQAELMGQFYVLKYFATICTGKLTTQSVSSRRPHGKRTLRWSEASLLPKKRMISTTPFR